MANEYSLSALLAEWLSTGTDDSGVKVSTLLGEVPNVGLSNQPIYHSTFLAEFVSTGQSPALSPVYLRQFFAEVMYVPNVQRWSPTFLNDDWDETDYDSEDPTYPPTPDGSGSFPGWPIFANDSVETDLSFEWNPYRPDVPIQIAESDQDTYEYLREQAELIRLQHNITQAGDTTFPWQMTSSYGDYSVHTRGSTSRFMHGDYGLLQARYVEFSDHWTAMKHPWVTQDESKNGEWYATNVSFYSESKRLIGVSAPFSEDSLAGKFGWVITEGRGLWTLFLESPTMPTRFQEFAWNPETNQAMIGPGRIAGMVLSAGPFVQRTDGTWVIPVGQWLVSVTGQYTQEYLEQIHGDEISDLEDRVTAIEEALGEDDIDLSSIQAQIDALRAALNQESGIRATVDAALAARISAIEAQIAGLPSAAEFNALTLRVTNVENALLALDARETNHYNELNQRIVALEAYRVVTEAEFTNVYTMIASLQDQITSLDENAGIFMPVVDGSIPPTFLQNADGGLVYVEIE